MSLFKKKSDNTIPEIPSAPLLPQITNDIKKSTTDLPTMPGDARDSINRDVIKSAIEDSSEKIGGDGAAISPSLSIDEISKPIQQAPMQGSILPDLPKPMAKQLPPPPRYDKPSFSQSLPIPPQKENADQMSPAEKPLEIAQEEKTVKKDANESIFVRIDKFHSAKHDVEEIERDLKQINNIIEKITDIKMREDEEVLEINKMIEDIKQKLGKLDTEIFNRV
jgi:hypothetical protein